MSASTDGRTLNSDQAGKLDHLHHLTERLTIGGDRPLFDGLDAQLGTDPVGGFSPTGSMVWPWQYDSADEWQDLDRWRSWSDCRLTDSVDNENA